MRVRGSIGFPDQLKVKLRWNENYTLDAGASGIAQRTICMNDPYDPDFTGGGPVTSAQGLDQWAQFYGKLDCRGSKIVVKPLGHDSNTPVQTVLFPQEDPTILYTSVINATNAPYAKWNWISPGTSNSFLLRSLVNYMGPRKIIGRGIGNDDEWVATTTGSPNNRTFWHIMSESISIASYQIWLHVSVTYYCILSQRRQIQDIPPG